VRDDVAVVGERPAAYEPVVDVVRAVDPVMSDRHGARRNADVRVRDAPLAVRDIAQHSPPPRLEVDRFADELGRRSVKSGLPLDDRRAGLTSHYASVA